MPSQMTFICLSFYLNIGVFILIQLILISYHYLLFIIMQVYYPEYFILDLGEVFLKHVFKWIVYFAIILNILLSICLFSILWYYHVGATIFSINKILMIFEDLCIQYLLLHYFLLFFFLFEHTVEEWVFFKTLRYSLWFLYVLRLIHSNNALISLSYRLDFLDDMEAEIIAKANAFRRYADNRFI